jgi:hypothetical protein
MIPAFPGATFSVRWKELDTRACPKQVLCTVLSMLEMGAKEVAYPEQLFSTDHMEIRSRTLKLNIGGWKDFYVACS